MRTLLVVFAFGLALEQEGGLVAVLRKQGVGGAQDERCGGQASVWGFSAAMACVALHGVSSGGARLVLRLHGVRWMLDGENDVDGVDCVLFA